ncbi:MAG: hypothetical protein ABSD59_25590, partial [Terracidiphilus sp.]
MTTVPTGPPDDGNSVTDAEAAELFAWFVPVTMTVCWAEIIAGDEYRPFTSIAPTTGLIAQPMAMGLHE